MILVTIWGLINLGNYEQKHGKTIKLHLCIGRSEMKDEGIYCIEMKTKPRIQNELSQQSIFKTQ